MITSYGSLSDEVLNIRDEAYRLVSLQNRRNSAQKALKLMQQSDELYQKLTYPNSDWLQSEFQQLKQLQEAIDETVKYQKELEEKNRSLNSMCLDVKRSLSVTNNYTNKLIQCVSELRNLRSMLRISDYLKATAQQLQLTVDEIQNMKVRNQEILTEKESMLRQILKILQNKESELKDCIQKDEQMVRLASTEWKEEQRVHEELLKEEKVRNQLIRIQTERNIKLREQRREQERKRKRERQLELKRERERKMGAIISQREQSVQSEETADESVCMNNQQQGMAMFNSQPEISWNHEIETPKGTSSNKIVSKQPVKVVIIDETDPLSRCYKVLIGILLVILTVLALQTLAG